MFRSTVNKGEIVGFTGLVGAGRTEIMEILYGYKPRDSGRIFLNGKETRIRTPRDAVRKGIGLIPEETEETGFGSRLVGFRQCRAYRARSLFEIRFAPTDRNRKTRSKHD